MSPPSVLAFAGGNWGLKAAAFGMAVFLWALVRVGTPDQRTVSVPVNVSLNDPEWVVMGDPVPATVQVRFRGPPTEVFRLTAMDGVAITVPVAGVPGEEMVVALEESWIPVDGYRGVQVEDIIPSVVHVHFDRVVTATIPLRITTRGVLPERLALTRDLSLTPNIVRVTGPASVIEQLDTLDIIPVDLSRVDERGTVQAVVDTAGRSRLTIVPRDITLRIPVEESIDRVFPEVAVVVNLGGRNESFEVLPSVIPITIRGSRTRVLSLDGRLLRAVVPPEALRGLGEGQRRRVPVIIEGLPSYLSLSMEVDTVVVRRQVVP